MSGFPTEVKSIVCVGAGYVGGPTMAVIAEKCPHIKVTVVDTIKEKIDAWNSGPLPIKEPNLEDIVTNQRGKNLFFSTDIEGSIKDADLVFLAVGTPTKTTGEGAGFAAELSYIETAGRTIAQYATKNLVIVEKSTVAVGYSRSLLRVMKANAKEGIKIQILSNPEFLAEGTAIKDLYNPDRVVIGCDFSEDGSKCASLLSSVYETWVPKSKVVIINIWSSELVKLASNAFLAQRISSINAISVLCEKSGANVDEISQALGMDSRIGPKFLKASVGFGGSCFQKDVLNLSHISDEFNLKEIGDYWRSIIQINDFQRTYFFNKVLFQMFNTLTDKHITVLGFAFKANTGDTRESSAIAICKKLLDENAVIHIYDPQVSREQIYADLQKASALITPEVLIKKVIIYRDPHEACVGTSGILVLTEWEEFLHLRFEEIYKNMGRPAFIFDGRNYLDRALLKKIGYIVHGVGLCTLELE